MSFGDIIKQLREERGYDQSYICQKLQIEQSTLSNYENNRRVPKIELISEFAKLYNVSTDYLLGLADEPNRRHEIRRLSDAIRIPVLGTVAAGIPLDAIQDGIDEWEEIPASMAAGGESFIALTIHGTSMEPKMSEGDVVIVRLQDDVESGDIALVYVNGNDATCKRVTKTAKGLWLKGLNDAFEPLFYSWDEVADTPVRIAGKVVELRAKF